uniref:glutamine synthetase n=1 Tax=viral metagenome TaxID=1070528 RepID=A0A6C0EN32_9ZZZZ
MSKVLAEYIWLDCNQKLRSKTKVLPEKTSLSDLPIWNYDGSSTGQATGENSEVLLKPIKIYPDPFRKDEHIFVLCECLNPDSTPHKTNTRHPAVEIFKNPKVNLEEPWYGIEQEYILLNSQTNTPLGWPLNKNWEPKPQGNYYCSVGADNISGREIVEKHLKMCLNAGLTMSGINAEVMLGQWEYQVGPCVGIDSADELTISRYILHRVCESFGVNATLEPKPVAGHWNGSGCHTNFSTNSTRNENGLKAIKEAMKRLEATHALHMEHYGSDNRLRMTGKCETASYDKFTYGLANRGASIRIPSETKNNGRGYFEDRRPGSNMDPYMVTSLLAKSILL